MEFRLPFDQAIPPELSAEVEKASVYATARLIRLRVTPDRLAAEVVCEEGAEAEVRQKVGRLIASMVGKFRSLGEPEELAHTTRRDEGPLLRGAFAELERRDWARSLGRGQVSLTRGAFALKRWLDDAIRDLAHARFGAEDDEHPDLLAPEVLLRCGYLGSFPQSVSLVSHLAEDFDGIEVYRALEGGRSRRAEARSWKRGISSHGSCRRATRSSPRSARRRRSGSDRAASSTRRW